MYCASGISLDRGPTADSSGSLKLPGSDSGLCVSSLCVAWVTSVHFVCPNNPFCVDVSLLAEGIVI